MVVNEGLVVGILEPKNVKILVLTITGMGGQPKIYTNCCRISGTNNRGIVEMMEHIQNANLKNHLPPNQKKNGDFRPPSK